MFDFNLNKDDGLILVVIDLEKHANWENFDNSWNKNIGKINTIFHALLKCCGFQYRILKYEVILWCLGPRWTISMIISQIVIEPEYYLLYKTYEPELTTFSKTLCMLYLLLFIFYLVVMIIMLLIHHYRLRVS